MRLKNLLSDRKGNSAPMTIALILGLLLLFCVISEFFRLMIIVQGVRDGLQEAVIGVVTSNYDDAYNGLREGYSGGYTLNGNEWKEMLDDDDMYGRLDSLLGTQGQGAYHVKYQQGVCEYRLSELNLYIKNAPLTPGDASRNLEADAMITLEIPFSFGWERMAPLKLTIRAKAVYMPKF